MIGPLVNSAAIFLGGVIGNLIGPKMSQDLRDNLPLAFGCASIGIGVVLLLEIKNLSPVVLALIAGTIIGELAHLETRIGSLAGKARGLINKVATPKAGMTHEEFIERYVALIVLFCCSATGIYGALTEGMTGDPNLLIVKSILDICTSAIFASTMGIAVGLLFIPQLIVQAILFALAHMIVPFTTPDMLADFSACGGLVLMATGFRICAIKHFRVANMIPGLFLVMPLSWAWTAMMS